MDHGEQCPACRIDVHHHLAPPHYRDLMVSAKALAAPLAQWSVAKSIEDMDRAGVTTSILSITAPGASLGNQAEARRVIRECNEYMARLVADHPGRFGMFVMLPLPDVEGSLREIEYGLDQLKADGVGMYTSYGDVWLGHPSFAPVFEELNRRKALINTHPTTASCCRNLIPGIPASFIEYGTDTTRAIANLVFNGAAARYPDVRIIFAHAGGTMPMLIERFDFHEKHDPKARQLAPMGARRALESFYYDTAQVANPAAMAALRQVIPVSQVVFGTDFPYRSAVEHVEGLRNCGIFSAGELRAIDRDNPLTLLPRFNR